MRLVASRAALEEVLAPLKRLVAPLAASHATARPLETAALTAFKQVLPHRVLPLQRDAAAAVLLDVAQPGVNLRELLLRRRLRRL